MHPRAKSVAGAFTTVGAGLVGAALGGLIVGAACLLIAALIVLLFGWERARTRLRLPGGELPVVPDAHRDELRALASAYSTTVAYQRQARGKQDGRHEASFWAHFPDAGKALADADAALLPLETAREAMLAWLDEADPDRGRLLIRHVEQRRPLRWSVDGGFLFLDGGWGIAEITDSTDRADLERPYEELLAAAEKTAQAEALHDAVAAWSGADRAAQEALEDVLALHVHRGKCALC